MAVALKQILGRSAGGETQISYALVMTPCADLHAGPVAV
jgi:hypothetical protein